MLCPKFDFKQKKLNRKKCTFQIPSKFAILWENLKKLCQIGKLLESKSVYFYQNMNKNHFFTLEAMANYKSVTIVVVHPVLVSNFLVTKS